MADTITISRQEYDRLREAVEELDELRAYDRARADLAAGSDELVPSEAVVRLIAGESPLRVWRELRGFNQSSLARASGVNRVYLADIETGRKRGSIEALRKLALALQVTIDDLATGEKAA